MFRMSKSITEEPVATANHCSSSIHPPTLLAPRLVPVLVRAPGMPPQVPAQQEPLLAAPPSFCVCPLCWPLSRPSPIA